VFQALPKLVEKPQRRMKNCFFENCVTEHEERFALWVLKQL
jgi:hypothetical protein